MVSSEEILRKYSAKIESEMKSSGSPDFSKEYLKFKQEMTPEMTRYTRWTKSLGSIVSVKPSPKESARIQNQLNIAHLDVTASQALSLAIISMLSTLFATCLLVAMIYVFSGTLQLLLFFLGFLASMFIFYYAYSMPKRLASVWRLRASSQMVPAVLYIVIYMKHTSNFERAVEFAAQHLEGPLALDFKKVFYNVEIGKFSTLKQSLDNYLEVWRDYSPEFIEAMHLVESSLFEPSESRRVQILEKSLQVILDGVYEKMLKYSREIRSPLTNVYMLGIILPTLGLALLPLASTLLGGVIRWIHVFVIFNILVPFGVFYMTSQVLLKRPGGHGSSEIEKNPDYYKFKSKKPWLIAGLVALPLMIIGFIPFIFQLPFITQQDFTLGQLGLPFLQDTKMFDFISTTSGKIGPFGPFSVLLSLFIPLSIAVFFSSTYKMKTKDLIKARKATQELESEFTNSLFQLGNRIGDGIPAEIAFARVAESSQGQITQQFFLQVNSNIQRLGMSLEQALFNKQRGAIIFYPSALIATSMKILVESVKKGLQAAARSLMSISDYVKNIHKIDERLRDLLAEIVSDMKSNMVFLAPLLAGIVVGLSTMITFILARLQQLTDLAGGNSATGFGFASIINIFDITKMVPPYYTQISIGIYLIEISFILTAALVTVDAGKDVLVEKYELSKNIRRGLTLYILTALISIIALSLLASIAISGLS